MNYDEWNEVKKTINNKDFVSNAKIGKVYWVNVGLNIGCEIYGKGDNFKRPVLVLNTFYISNNKAFLGVPLSSKTSKTNKHKMIIIDKNKTEQALLLNQIRIFDNKRIISLSSIKITNEDFCKIVEKINKEIIPRTSVGTH